MGHTPESKVKAELDEYLDSLGTRCFYYKPVPMGYGKRGVPDYIICYRGFFLAPETKRPKGGKSEAFQERVQEDIRAAGGVSGRVTDVEQLRVWVRAIDMELDG